MYIKGASYTQNAAWYKLHGRRYLVRMGGVVNGGVAQAYNMQVECAHGYFHGTCIGSEDGEAHELDSNGF